MREMKGQAKILPAGWDLPRLGGPRILAARSFPLRPHGNTLRDRFVAHTYVFEKHKDGGSVLWLLASFRVDGEMPPEDHELLVERYEKDYTLRPMALLKGHFWWSTPTSRAHFNLRLAVPFFESMGAAYGPMDGEGAWVFGLFLPRRMGCALRVVGEKDYQLWVPL
jgi:hypothetical protein